MFTVHWLTIQPRNKNLPHEALYPNVVSLCIQPAPAWFPQRPMTEFTFWAQGSLVKRVCWIEERLQKKYVLHKRLQLNLR